MTTPAAPLSSTFAPAPLHRVRPFYWAVRRELWEYRSIYLAPLIVAGVFLVGHGVSLVHLPWAPGFDLAYAANAYEHRAISHYDVASGLIMGVALLITIFYSLTALHGERSDRSILFWKSMPVSDLTTVLSKAAIPIVVIPIIAFFITILTQWTMLLISSAVYVFHGLPAAGPWIAVQFGRMSLMLLFHLILIHGLWYSPMYAFLLLVSAWARRAPFLWAALPVLAIIAVEKLAFNTSYLVDLLKDRIGGGNLGVPFTSGMPAMNPLDPTMHLNLLLFVLSPGLWGGLLLTAVFLYAATRLRRYRTPL